MTQLFPVLVRFKNPDQSRTDSKRLVYGSNIYEQTELFDLAQIGDRLIGAQHQAVYRGRGNWRILGPVFRGLCPLSRHRGAAAIMFSNLNKLTY